MLSFPNAKINLGLNITFKRPDGYHNISSCFYPVGWTDILEIIPSDKLQFSSSGLDIPGDPADNLCLRAYRLLKKDFAIPPVRIHLHKVIPTGAGLGGGSADGAFTCKALNDIFSLQLSHEQMENYAGRLGSDCPFFIENKPALAAGVGDELSSTNLDLSGKYICIVYPGTHISTREAYAGIVPRPTDVSIEAIIDQPIACWKNALANDFEGCILPNYPEIRTIKNSLYEQGAAYASMTGSGSAVFGIFEKQMKIELAGKCLVWEGEL